MLTCSGADGTSKYQQESC